MVGCETVSEPELYFLFASPLALVTEDETQDVYKIWPNIQLTEIGFWYKTCIVLEEFC